MDRLPELPLLRQALHRAEIPTGDGRLGVLEVPPAAGTAKPATGNPGTQKQAHRHRSWATRIRRDYMGFPPDDAGDLFFQSAISLQRPKGCRITHERWKALRRLASAHETLWQLSELDFLPSMLGLLHGMRGAVSPTTDDKIRRRDAKR